MGRGKSTIRTATLTLALQGGLGCVPSHLFRYGPIAVPDPQPPELSLVVVGRSALVLVDERAQPPSLSGDVVIDDATVAIFPPDATVRGAVRTRARRAGQTVEADLTIDVRAADGTVVAWVNDEVGRQGELVFDLAERGRSGRTVTVSWKGKPPRPDALEIDLQKVCVGDSCEDLKIEVPIRSPVSPSPPLPARVTAP